MRPTLEQIRRVAATSTRLLILGESGAGKETVARTVHVLSDRAERPFVVVDCATIPGSLIEAELFGYERGSFTGAVRPKAGFLERAGGGTLLLNDITAMPMAMQAKLVPVLQHGRLVRVGGTADVDVRCRVLVAADRDPQQAVAEGRLRPDLLALLATSPLRVPPLRERGDDVLPLAEHFLAVLNADQGDSKTLSTDSLSFLREHDWPGNVRELRDCVQRAWILADHQLQLRSATTRAGGSMQAETERVDHIQVAVGTPLAEVERQMIVATLKRCGGNKTRTAAMLGVSLKTLYNRLNEYRASAIAASSAARPLPSRPSVTPTVQM